MADATLQGKDNAVDGDAAAIPPPNERESIAARRARAGVEGNHAAWALAFSGGGVRSATICLGVLRGLARTGLLRKFDYLSTVSGGGYIGASFGRLFAKGRSVDDVEKGIASDGSMWLWWLRNNGRYLTPAGAKDLGFASASIVRGVIATHLEIGVLLLLLAALVTWPHLVLSLAMPLGDKPEFWHALFSRLGSAWWWLLPLPLFGLAHQLLAYWFARERRTIPSVVLIAAIALASVPLSLWLFVRAGLLAARQGPPPMAIAGLCVLALIVAAPASAWLASGWDALMRRTVAERRLKRTRRASYFLWALAICVAVGTLDWASWRLTAWFWNPDSTIPYKTTAVVALLLAAGRLLLPEIQRWQATTKRPAINLHKLLNIIGLVLAALVALFWTTVFTAAVFHPGTRLFVFPQGEWPWFAPQVRTWLLLVAACLAYVIATRRSFDLLNLASLHNFYRARIERAYVSSGNCGRSDARFHDRCPLDPVSRESTQHIAPLTEAIAGDDIAIEEYAPHAQGGPIHLVNCCINQSIDDRTGIYNADRKGIALTIGPFGPESGAQFATTGYEVARGKYTDAGTLSRWIAISGAAASTGMGSRTSPGFAGLLFMSGLRLGYWTKALIAQDKVRNKAGPARKRMRDFLLRFSPKPFAIVGESIARFPGLSSPIWYVSDGGHFDNTGIYALLKRQPALIVAVDCGADPKYLFADLESVVRKAKIDYGATIEFLDASRLAPGVDPALIDHLGTPETIGTDAGAKWLVLGRIRYAGGRIGTLLVVKPRRLDAMPFDVVAYADRNHDFPQQTTGDQFFDEAQWEAYHQLGLLLGSRITPSLVTSAEASVAANETAPSSLARAEKQATVQSEVVARRDRATAVRASVGAGLSLSVLLGAWQGIEQFRETRREANADYEARFEALDDKIRTAPIATLLPFQFRSFAADSDARDDGRFDILKERLNARCETLRAKKDPEVDSCLYLYSGLAAEPQPFYDYWFADRIGVPPSVDNRPDDLGLVFFRSRRMESTVDEVVQDAAAAADEPTIEEAAEDVAKVIAASPSTDVAEVAAAPVAPALPAAPVVESALPEPPPPPPPPERTSATAGTTPTTTAATCKGAHVYLHVYDEETRPLAARIAGQLRTSLDIADTPIENVVATAERRRRSPPYVWSTPALVVHRGTASGCVAAVKATMPANTIVRDLPASFASRAGMIEIWLPPNTVSYAK